MSTQTEEQTPKERLEKLAQYIKDNRDEAREAKKKPATSEEEKIWMDGFIAALNNCEAFIPLEMRKK